MSLQAEILNEAEDLKDVPMDLVVGVPNFRFKKTVSPLALERVMRNALQAAAPQVMGQFSNALFTQRASEHRAPNRSAGHGGSQGTLSLPSELTAGGKQDLFIYNVPKVSLKRGGRAALPIFTASVPYRDVYTWRFHVKRKSERASTQGNLTSPLKLATNQVWHQIELENVTKVPWTTGAAMVMEGHLPLGQELLTYTSAGSAVRVPITVATDMRGTYSEKEVKRTPNAQKFHGHSYMKVEKTGALLLTNHKSIDVDVEIVCDLGGSATEALAKGNISVDDFRNADWTNYYGHSYANQHSTVVWKTTLKAGKSFSPKVMYHYFLRH
jgi:hypothetical protein